MVAVTVPQRSTVTSFIFVGPLPTNISEDSAHTMAEETSIISTSIVIPLPPYLLDPHVVPLPLSDPHVILPTAPKAPEDDQFFYAEQPTELPPSMTVLVQGGS